VKPKRILIFNFKFMGDLLIATALFRSLKETYPETYVAVVARKEYEEVLAGNPDIDELIVFDRTLMRTLKWPAKLHFEWGFLKRLRQGRFDTCYAMHPGDRTCLWAWLSGAKIRIGTSVQPLSFLLNKTVSVSESHLAGLDYLEYYFALAEPLGIKEKTRRTAYILTDEARREARRQYPMLFQEVPNLVVGLHPGASATARQWPWERFSRLADELISSEKVQVVVFAGPGEEDLAQKVFEHIQGEDKAIVVASSLRQFAACLERCDLFIGNDTGPRHMTVALGVPTITLMGQKDPKVWGIYTEEQQHWTIQKKVSCQPCEKADCEDNICMTAIPVEEVVALSWKVLRVARKPERVVNDSP
jgi:heptosyltransferase-2